MKSLSELEAIRDKMAQTMNLREENRDPNKIKILVGMATCGIAAGARPVLNAFVEEVGKRELQHVMVSQVGCIGMCRLEPIAEVITGDGSKTTYVRLTADKARRIVNEHIVNGRVVTEYTIGAAEK